jgi:hypothetical protein
VSGTEKVSGTVVSTFLAWKRFLTPFPVRGYGEFNHEADAEQLANIRKDMETLIEAKLKMFPHDLRQVVQARIINVGGQDRIEAAAMRTE